MNVEAEIMVINEKINHLEACAEKLDKLKNGDHEQEKTIGGIESQIKGMEDFVESHKEWHDKQDLKIEKLATKKDDRKWQLWIVLITFVVMTIGDIIVTKWT